MDQLTERFKRLGINNSPGREVLQKEAELDLRGAPLSRPDVNLFYGNVYARIPIRVALDFFVEGFKKACCITFAKYCSSMGNRDDTAAEFAAFTGASIDVGGC